MRRSVYSGLELPHDIYCVGLENERAGTPRTKLLVVARVICRCWRLSTRGSRHYEFGEEIQTILLVS